MRANHSKLSDATLQRIRSGWAKELGLPLKTFPDVGRLLFTREDFSFLVVVQLQDSIVIICPPQLEALIAPLMEEELFNLVTLEQILNKYNPKPIGVATLSYLESDTFVDRCESILI